MVSTEVRTKMRINEFEFEKITVIYEIYKTYIYDK